MFTAEIKHLDWLKTVMGHGTVNPDALFQRSYATLKFVYENGFWTNT